MGAIHLHGHAIFNNGIQWLKPGKAVQQLVKNWCLTRQNTKNWSCRTIKMFGVQEQNDDLT